MIRTRMTRTAYSQGVVNMLICAVGVFGVWLMIGWLGSLMSGQTRLESGGIAFAILWIGSSAVLVGEWVRGLRHRGNKLLDCGHPPARWLFLVNAAIFFMVGVTGSNLDFTGSLRQWGSWFAFSFAAYWGLMGTGRLEIREHGIWVYRSLLQWKCIKSYSWSDDGTLLIKTTGPLSLRWRNALPVPIECVEEFKHQLSQHVSTTQPDRQELR